MAKAALITGAAKRIGKVIAMALAGRGYDIAIHYSTSRGDADATANEIRALGRRCAILQADLGDMKQVLPLVGDAVRELGSLDLLVNSASIFERGLLVETEEEFYDRVMSINLKAPFFLARQFARVCKRGQIINLLDARITKTSAAYFVYAMTKKSLADFTEMAARQLAPDIRVNGICPGLMLPPPGQPPEYLQGLAASVPLQRVGSPEMIANAAVFLAENDYITGQTLFIDGGQHLS